jgi:hypothetical protein
LYIEHDDEEESKLKELDAELNEIEREIQMESFLSKDYKSDSNPQEFLLK